MPNPDEHSDRPKDGERERRYVQTGKSELRLLDGDNGKPKTLVGYAAVFNSLSEELWGFREQVRPGAFAESLRRGDDVRATIEHQGGLTTLGRSTAGTLKLAEDTVGLRSEIILPDTQASRDVMELIERGDISQMSFAFTVRKQEWYEPDEGDVIRTLIEVDLHDVSVVTYPAYVDTSVAVRSLNQWRETTDEAIAVELEYQRRRLEAFDKAPLVG